MFRVSNSLSLESLSPDCPSFRRGALGFFPAAGSAAGLLDINFGICDVPPVFGTYLVPLGGSDLASFEIDLAADA